MDLQSKKPQRVHIRGGRDLTGELDWQRRIIQSTKAQGGWGAKWATQWTVGVPDLILCLQGLGMFAMEVKLFDSVKPGWSRKIHTTDKQKHELSKINEAGGLGLVGVVVKYDSGKRVSLVASDPGRERLGENHQLPMVEWHNKSFDVAELVLKHRRIKHVGE
mgnify:CR=1 FL=1